MLKCIFLNLDKSGKSTNHLGIMPNVTHDNGTGIYKIDYSCMNLKSEPYIFITPTTPNYVVSLMEYNNKTCIIVTKPLEDYVSICLGNVDKDCSMSIQIHGIC